MKTLYNSYARRIRQTDVLLLLFLLCISVDKVWIKPVALLIPLLWMRRTDWKPAALKAPVFYPLILLFLPIQYLVHADFSATYLLYFGIGLCYWLMCWISFSVLYARAGQKSTEALEATLHSFFLINATVTLLQLLNTMLATKSLNPFGLWDNPVYGNSTGDHLKGIFLAPCYINFFCNAFFAFYFLYRRHFRLSLLAVTVLCITACNFAIIFFLPLFFIFSLLLRQRAALAVSLLSVLLTVSFYVFVSTGNIKYMAESIYRVEHIPDDQLKGLDTTASFTKVVAQADDVAFFRNKKGKVMAVEQTMQYISSGIRPALFGAGMGNFSSLLAQKQSDIQQEQKSRLFRLLPIRIAPEYAANHYAIEKRVYNLPTDWHSIQQLPASFLNQILGEYGLIGLLLFLYGYIFFILKRTPARSFLLPMALLLGYFLLFDYLFEYLSIVILFELFYILQRKQAAEKPSNV